MAYDPGLYLLETALADFAPLTDAMIITRLVRADAGRSAEVRKLATCIEEGLATLLKADLPAGTEAQRETDMSASYARLEASA